MTEHCTVEDIGMNITGPDAGPFIEALDKYLYDFAKPVPVDPPPMVTNWKCLKCDSVITGICGTFTWGIAHGEGNCSNCGWPMRAYHNPRKDGEPMFNRPFELMLQYHPENVEIKDNK